MRRLAAYCLIFIQFIFGLPTFGQLVKLLPTGIQILPNQGEPYTTLYLNNQGNNTSEMPNRAASFIINQANKEFSINSLGSSQSISFYVRSVLPLPSTIPTPPVPILKLSPDGTVTLPDGIRIGGPAAAGALRWTGTAFEGYTGTAWVPLSGQYYTYGYIPALQTSGTTVSNSPCQVTCDAAGGIPWSDQATGYTCIAQDGRVGNNVVSNVFTGYTCYYNTNNLGVLAKCYCRFPK